MPVHDGPDDEDEEAWSPIRGPLTAEIADIRSPIRQFLGDRLTRGLRDVQRRYRQGAPPLVVPAGVQTGSSPRNALSPNAIGPQGGQFACDAPDPRSGQVMHRTGQPHAALSGPGASPDLAAASAAA